MSTKSKVLTKISYLLDLLICLLFLITTLSKGGFYKEDVVFPTLTICVVGFVCVTLKLVMNIMDNGLITKNKWVTLLDTLVVLLPVSYFLPVIFGTYVSLENSISECIKHVCFSIVYFIIRTSKNPKLYTNTIILAACIISIFGIDELTFRVIEKILPNSSIRYLSTSTGALSSIMQYANVSALFMLVGSLLLKYELFESNHKLVVKGVCAAIITILDVSVVLTLSRMNLLLLIIADILIFIFYYIKGRPLNSFKILLVLFVTMILAGFIETNIYAGNFFTVIITLISMAGVAMVVGLTSVIDKLVAVITNLTVYKKARLTRKKVAVLILIMLGFTMIISFVPVSLKIVYTPEEDIKTVTRKIYDVQTGKIEWGVKLKNKDENSKFDFTLYETLNDNTKHEVFRVSYEPVKNGEFKYDINISENMKFLEVVINVYEGDLEVTDFKIGDKTIYLSHFLVSDNMLTKIIDTFKFGENNEFRNIYYKDALKLIQKSPIIGIGGEGFKLKHQSVQDIKYVSSEAHSMPLQIAVEAGIIGLIIYLLILVVCAVISLKILIKGKEKKSILWIFAIFIVMFIISSFDLVGAFGAYTLLFGIVAGIIVNEYKKQEFTTDSYMLDNKSAIAMIKICVLSLCIIVLILASVYEYRVYRASLIKPLKVKVSSEQDTLTNTYNKIVALEEKLNLDVYNADYMMDLYEEYETYIGAIQAYVLEENEEVLKEYTSLITRQKDLVDKMVKYEYHNKYVIDKVASCYFDHYIEYTNIFSEKFKDEEVAYSFYLSYAIKMLRRIKELAPNNTAADNMYVEIITENISRLEMQAATLNSESILEAKLALEVLKEEGKIE